MLSNGKLFKSLLHGGDGGNITINGGTVTATGSNGGAGVGGGDYGGNHGSVTFGAGVAFTVNAGTDKDNTSPKTTTEYASNHSAAYVKIEKIPDPV